MRSRSMRITGGMFLYLPSDRISHFRRPSNIRSESIACQKGKSKKNLKKVRRFPPRPPAIAGRPENGCPTKIKPPMLLHRRLLN
nr:MAG TPA: hypothetical protein [Caudoviricetes sp.]DAL77717.1 MAG TPA: hypothetical protein [Bacteriophage sp.]DAT54390.1 MAG TPA: hypothetical protein [Caudoviricetes sp.]